MDVAIENTYVFIRFDDTFKCKEYRIYKRQLINTMMKYFSVVFTKEPDPNIVSKTFSVYLILGCSDEMLRTEQARNIVCSYHAWKSPFPNICDIERQVFTSYCGFQRNIKPGFERNNVIVFDMDETLIDRDTIPYYKEIFKEISEYRDYFKYIILWTHGLTSYLSEVKLDFEFDLYMSRNDEHSENKGLGAVLRELNKSCGVSHLDFCVLVDDTPSNFENDYDLFLHIVNKPSRNTYKKALGEVVSRMSQYYRKKQFNHILKI
jgi:hypothetical protein